MSLSPNIEQRLTNLRATRIAVVVSFAVLGLGFTNWASRIPEVQRSLHLSEGELGLTLLGMPAGLVLTLPFVGSFIERFSSRTVLIGGAVLMCSMLPLLAIAPSQFTLASVLFIFGASSGFMDVAMNVQAVDVERQAGHSLMSSFHAAFSVGGFLGAAMSSGIIALGVEMLVHMVIAASVGIGLVLAVAGFMLFDLSSSSDESDQSPPVFTLPSRALLPIGIIAFASAIGEGAMADWTTVYLRNVVEATASIAALGIAAFSITMTVGRLLGDGLINRFGAATMIRFGGVLGSLGLLIAVFSSTSIPAIVGFAVVGIGLATVIPIAFSRAGNMPDVPSGTGIASVATLGYSGFLAGPPVIGLVADASSLRVSFALVALLVASMIYMARYVRQPPA
jgi:MFS family permease